MIICDGRQVIMILLCSSQRFGWISDFIKIRNSIRKWMTVLIVIYVVFGEFEARRASGSLTIHLNMKCRRRAGKATQCGSKSVYLKYCDCIGGSRQRWRISGWQHRLLGWWRSKSRYRLQSAKEAKQAFHREPPKKNAYMIWSEMITSFLIMSPTSLKIFRLSVFESETEFRFPWVSGLAQTLKSVPQWIRQIYQNGQANG